MLILILNVIQQCWNFVLGISRRLRALPEEIQIEWHRGRNCENGADRIEIKIRFFVRR